MRQEFPGMIGLRHALERDMRESDEQIHEMSYKGEFHYHCISCTKFFKTKVMYDWICPVCKEKHENHPTSNPGDGRV